MTNRDGDVDYSSFSSEELREAYESISPSKYPTNFKNLSDEIAARRVSTGHSPDEPPLGSELRPMSRGRSIAAKAILVSMLCVFFYGFVRFLDGPIQECGQNQYCGKQGQPHTLDDFRVYTFWGRAMFCVWPGGLLALFVLTRKRST
jgi:hypothetical protein